MDEYTACEQAYKNGYEQGKKDAVKHGEWKWDKSTIQCSVCGFGMFPYGYFFMGGECFSANDSEYKPPYCPNCGADMRGDTQ